MNAESKKIAEFSAGDCRLSTLFNIYKKCVTCFSHFTQLNYFFTQTPKMNPLHILCEAACSLTQDNNQNTRREKSYTEIVNSSVARSTLEKINSLSRDGDFFYFHVHLEQCLTSSIISIKHKEKTMIFDLKQITDQRVNELIDIQLFFKALSNLLKNPCAKKFSFSSRKFIFVAVLLKEEVGSFESILDPESISDILKIKNSTPTQEESYLKKKMSELCPPSSCERSPTTGKYDDCFMEVIARKTECVEMLIKKMLAGFRITKEEKVNDARDYWNTFIRNPTIREKTFVIN